MPTITEVDKRYLKKIVKEALKSRLDEQDFNKKWDPSAGWIEKTPQMTKPGGYFRAADSQPLAKDLQDMKDIDWRYERAFRIVASSHERRYKKILKSLSFEEKWVLNTAPAYGGLDSEAPSDGQRRSLSFVASRDVKNLIPRLMKRKITIDKDESIINIQKGISDFLNSMDLDQSSLRHLNDNMYDNKESLQYAENLYMYLWEEDPDGPGSELFETDMNKVILKVLNLRNPVYERYDSFSHFYYETLSVLNNKRHGTESLLVSYVTHKLARDKEVRDSLDNWLMALAIATIFLPGFAIGAGVKVMALVIETLILDVALPMALGAGSSILYTKISKEEAMKPLNDLLEEIVPSDEPVNIELGNKYFEALEVAERFLTHFVYESAGNEEKQINKIQAMIPSSSRKILNRPEDLGTNLYLRNVIKGDIEKIEEFFRYEKLIQPQEIKVTLGRRAKISLDRFSKPSRNPGASLLSDMWDEILDALNEEKNNPILSLEESSKIPFKTGAAETRIDNMIHNVIFAGTEYEDTFTKNIPYLTSTFLSIYREFNDNPISTQKAKNSSKGHVRHMWNIFKNSYGKFASKGTPHKDIDRLMKSGWCYLGTMPLRHLTGESDSLTLGILSKSGQSAMACSIITEDKYKNKSALVPRGVTGFDLFESFAKLIKYGTIGPRPGKIIFPLHDGGNVSLARKTAERRANKMEEALEELRKSYKNQHVREDFYRKRWVFMKSYANFYRGLDDVLVPFHVGPGEDLDGGRCGGSLPGELQSFFKAAMMWDGEIL